MPKLPGIPHLQAVRALEKAGFRVVRESKHIVMSNGQRILTIPRANPVNAFTMGTCVSVQARSAEVRFEAHSAGGDRCATKCGGVATDASLRCPTCRRGCPVA